MAESAARDALLRALQCAAAELQARLESGDTSGGNAAQRQHEHAASTAATSGAKGRGTAAGKGGAAAPEDEAPRCGSSSSVRAQQVPAGNRLDRMAGAAALPSRQRPVTATAAVPHGSATPRSRSGPGSSHSSRDVSRQAQQQHQEQRHAASSAEAVAALTAMCGPSPTTTAERSAALGSAAAGSSTVDTAVVWAGKLSLVQWLCQHAFGADRLRALQALQHALGTTLAGREPGAESAGRKDDN